jgi:hypothetical protein
VTWSRIDWFSCWKFYHWPFFATYASLAIASAALLTLRYRPEWARIWACAACSGIIIAAFNTWTPLIPVVGGGVLVWIGGDQLVNSMRVGLPTVAVGMGIEGGLLQLAVIRLIFRGTQHRPSFLRLLIVNTLAAVTALVLGVLWILGHPVQMIA